MDTSTSGILSLNLERAQDAYEYTDPKRTCSTTFHISNALHFVLTLCVEQIFMKDVVDRLRLESKLRDHLRRTKKVIFILIYILEYALFRLIDLSFTLNVPRWL